MKLTYGEKLGLPVSDEVSLILGELEKFPKRPGDRPGNLSGRFGH